MLPVIAAEKLADYIDVPETGFFTSEETETFKAGWRKQAIHVNQLNSIGGIQTDKVRHLHWITEQ
jgi:hypothetical protein